MLQIHHSNCLQCSNWQRVRQCSSNVSTVQTMSLRFASHWKVFFRMKIADTTNRTQSMRSTTKHSQFFIQRSNENLLPATLFLSRFLNQWETLCNYCYVFSRFLNRFLCANDEWIKKEATNELKQEENWKATIVVAEIPYIHFKFMWSFFCCWSLFHHYKRLASAYSHSFSFSFPFLLILNFSF